MSDTFQLGPYTVRLVLRPDNPAFPAYAIFRGEKLIGKQFSYPTQDDCRALERERREETQIRERRPVWLAEPFAKGQGSFRTDNLQPHRRPGRPRKDEPRQPLQKLFETVE